jgi:AcrR family transcriptional regulator
MRKVRTYSSDTHLVKEKRAHIVNTAVDLIVQRGYDRTNMRELAKVLGMSTGGLYHYIGAKEDILYLIVNYTSDMTQQLLDDCEKFRNGSARQHLKRCVKRYLAGTEQSRNFFNFVNHVMLSLPVKDRRIVYENESRIVAYFQSLLEEGVKKGEFKAHDSKCLAHNIVAFTNAWANRGWYLKRYYNLDQYIKEQTGSLLSLLAAVPATGARAR